MKITEHQAGITPQGGPRKAHEEVGQRSDFQQVMKEVKGQTEAAGVSVPQVRSSASPEALNVIQGVRILQTGKEGRLKADVLDELQTSLDLVDFYASKLADKSMPASRMDPLVGHLEDRLTKLKDLEATPELPEKLKSILSDLTLTIGKEVAKFRRGDYA